MQPKLQKDGATSFRLSAEYRRILAQVALDFCCANDAEAFRALLKWYSTGKIPPPIKPAITSIEGLDHFIRSLDCFIEALGPTARHVEVRFKPGDTPEREAEIRRWYERARKTYIELEEIMNQLRHARFGILACKVLDVEKLREADKFLILLSEKLGEKIKNPMIDSEDGFECHRRLALLNELRCFLHACGINCEEALG